MMSGVILELMIGDRIIAIISKIAKQEQIFD
jgi:hypothetical protein